MRARITNIAIEFRQTSIERTTVSVVCMKILKSMVYGSLSVVQFEEIVDVIMFTVQPTESKSVYITAMGPS